MRKNLLLLLALVSLAGVGVLHYRLKPVPNMKEFGGTFGVPGDPHGSPSTPDVRMPAPWERVPPPETRERGGDR